jgi:hypothetical protein
MLSAPSRSRPGEALVFLPNWPTGGSGLWEGVLIAIEGVEDSENWSYSMDGTGMSPLRKMYGCPFSPSVDKPMAFSDLDGGSVCRGMLS